MNDIRPIVGNWKSRVKRLAWYFVCHMVWLKDEIVGEIGEWLE